MPYTIGKFSKITGVTRDTIRLYEKQGIIKPAKDKQNQYRYFNDLDARPLLMSRFLRSLHISLEDVAALIKNAELADIVNKIEEAEQNLQDQLNSLLLLLDKIKEIKQEIREVDSLLNTFQLKTWPGIYRLQQTDRDLLLETTITASNWMSALPFCFFSLKIKADSFLTQDDYDYNWGLAVFENELQYLNLKITDEIEYIKPHTYLSVTVKSPHNERLLASSKDFILSYLKDNNFAVTGDIIGRLILSEYAHNQAFSYIDLNFPIG